MGNSACSACTCGQAELEFTFGDEKHAAKLVAEGLAELAEAVEEQAEELQAAAGQVAKAADDVKEQATQIADASGGAVELVAEEVAELAEAVEEHAEEVQAAAGQVAEAAKDATEKVISTIDATMDAAAAAVTGTMIVDFADEKGSEQQVTFKTRKLGFELGLSGGSFCRAKGQARVVAKQVTRGGQAEALGVKRGWRAKSVNGVDFTGLEQAKKLLADLALKFPEA